MILSVTYKTIKIVLLMQSRETTKGDVEIVYPCQPLNSCGFKGFFDSKEDTNGQKKGSTRYS